MSKAKKVVEEITAAGEYNDIPKKAKFSDLPEPLQKSLGFLGKNIVGVNATARTYDVGTNLNTLSGALVANLAQLGKRLAGIQTIGDKIVISVRKD